MWSCIRRFAVVKTIVSLKLYPSFATARKAYNSVPRHYAASGCRHDLCAFGFQKEKRLGTDNGESGPRRFVFRIEVAWLGNVSVFGSSAQRARSNGVPTNLDLTCVRLLFVRETTMETIIVFLGLTRGGAEPFFKLI